MKLRIPVLICAAGLLLPACGAETSADEMHYIKTTVLYDTLYDMYASPDGYLGKQFHMVGTLYPSTDDQDETFYSLYTSDADGGHGIGLELDWSDYSGIEDYDTITVEGRLDTEKGTSNGEKVEYLILRVSMLEKRAD